MKKILETFKGKQKQIPPMYSAIQVEGKKLYEYARQGKIVDIKSRDIEIYNIELVSVLPQTQEIIYKVKCSKGTYIRTLSENIAEKLGSVGFMKSLNRTMVGNFEIKDAVTISEIEKKEILDKKFITIEKFFKENNKIILNDTDLKKFLNGVKLSINMLDGIYRVYDKNNIFIGVGILNENEFKRDICIDKF